MRFVNLGESIDCSEPKPRSGQYNAVPPRLGFTRGGDEPLVRFPADRREGDCQFIKMGGLTPAD